MHFELHVLVLDLVLVEFDSRPGHHLEQLDIGIDEAGRLVVTDEAKTTVFFEFDHPGLDRLLLLIADQNVLGGDAAESVSSILLVLVAEIHYQVWHVLDLAREHHLLVSPHLVEQHHTSSIQFVEHFRLQQVWSHTHMKNPLCSDRQLVRLQ